MDKIYDLTVGEIVVGAAAIGTVLTAAVLAFRRARAFWTNHAKPMWEALTKVLILLNGRDAVTLPEDSTVETAPALKGGLDRLESIEKGLNHVLVQSAKQNMQMAEIGAKIDTIEHEVQHNGGGTIKDAMRRVEERQVVQGSVLGYIGKQLDRGEDRFEHGTRRFERIEDHLGIGPLEGDPGKGDN